MSYLMEIDNLGKRYDDFELSGVSLAVEPGCVVGFIGSNGAGKTTTIKAILGIIAADAGTVRLFGEPVTCGSAALDAMSPLKVLGRGYSIARNENGTLIASVKDAAPGERLELRLSDGSLACRVEERKCL